MFKGYQTIQQLRQFLMRQFQFTKLNLTGVVTNMCSNTIPGRPDREETEKRVDQEILRGSTHHLAWRWLPTLRENF